MKEGPKCSTNLLLDGSLKRDAFSHGALHIFVTGSALEVATPKLKLLSRGGGRGKGGHDGNWGLQSAKLFPSSLLL